MKHLFYLIVIAVIGYFVWQFAFQPVVQKSTTQTQDPVAEMARIAASFPRKVSKVSGLILDIIDVSYDVQKTESMVNPVVGYLNFTEGHIVTGPEWLGSFQAPVTMEMQMIFHWVNNHWMFSRYINRENGKDFTDIPGGRAFLDSAEVGPFLVQFGRTFSSPTTSQRGTTPTPPAAKSTPKPTATPVQYRYFLNEPVTINIDYGSVTVPAQTEVTLVRDNSSHLTVRAMGKEIQIPSTKVTRVQK